MVIPTGVRITTMERREKEKRGTRKAVGPGLVRMWQMKWG